MDSWMKRVRSRPSPARMKRLLATVGLPPLPTVEALGEEASCQAGHRPPHAVPV
jgi:hypothetical protein